MQAEIRWGMVVILFAVIGSLAAAADPKPLDFVGRVEASATVELRSRVDGPVVSVNCKAGQIVQKGMVLFEIDPRQFEAELRRAEAGILQAESKLRFYAVERARTLKLIQTGGVNQSEVDRIDAERLNAEAMLQSAKASVDLARLNLEYTKITAPMNGRIGNLLAPGNIVRADRYLLGTLVADDPIFIAFDVDEKSALHMMKAGGVAGQSAAVGFADEDGFPHQARLESVDAQFDAKSGTIRCRLVLPNADRRVLPGMSARVRLNPGPAR